MADNTLTTWAPYLQELQGKVFEVFSSEAPFLAEISGYDNTLGMVDRASKVQRITREMDGGRERFSGRYVRHQVVLSGFTGGGYVGEATTWNVPHALNQTEAHINLVRLLFPFSLSVDVERDSMDNSAIAAVGQLVAQTTSAVARMENLEFVAGDGTGKIHDITGGTTGTLVISVGTGGNFDVLVPGSVWDIATKTTGVVTTNGKRRKIDSVNEAAGTITFSTTAVASDGDAGNITFSTLEGIYIPGTESTPALAGTLAAQTLAQAAATTGTFEAIDKAANANWQGTDGRGGDTSVVALSATMLDAAVRRGRRSGLGKWDFAIGDPQAIDLFKQGLYASVRYDSNTTTLKSGFSGIAYDGADAPITLIKEPMMTKGTVRLIDKASFTLYGDAQGPKFLDDDGAMFRRFSRNLTKEADMLDRHQLGVGRCNTLVTLANLAVAP